MALRDRRTRFPEPSWFGVARDMTVGEIFDCLTGENDGEPGVTPWRRGHRVRVRAAVETPGLW